MKEKLFALQDQSYKEFSAKLLPNLDPDTIIGVRTPQLRTMAKVLGREELGELPHAYYEENNLHAFYIERIKDFDACLTELERFLPYVDNWATCDSMRPKCFKHHRKELLERIVVWLRSKHVYTVRFAIGMLMTHYLDEDFYEDYPRLVASVYSEEYYVNMMIAWYFATALAKQYDAVIGYLEQEKLPLWVHNKTIQKAVESFRITEEEKNYLRTLRKKACQ